MSLLQVILVISFALLLNAPSYSQTEYFPKGVYMSLDEVLNKKPSKQNVFKVVSLLEKKTFWSLGGEYKIEPINYNDEKLFKKAVYAVSDGNNLYINCRAIKMQNYYTKVLASGQYIVFSDVKVGGDAASYSRMFFYLRVLNVKIGKIEYLNSEYLFRELTPYRDILQQYLSEDKKVRESPEILLKYIIALNEKLKQ